MQSPTEINLYKEGGPAFPVSIPGCGDNGWHGMALRDWFAGQALPGLLASAEEGSPWKAFAVEAYAMADAMLEARTPVIAEQREKP